MAISYEWRGEFENAEVNALHAEGFEHAVLDATTGAAQVERHSLGWVCAREAGRLVGFVNVAWDGAVHAFILDTLVTADVQRRGVGTELVAVATRQAQAAGCEWLHVDFDDDLQRLLLRRLRLQPDPRRPHRPDLTRAQARRAPRQTSHRRRVLLGSPVTRSSSLRRLCRPVRPSGASPGPRPPHHGTWGPR